MAMDLNPGGIAEQAVAAAIKNALLAVYGSRGAEPAEMGNLATAITQGVLAGLQHVKEHADVVGVISGPDSISGGVD